jgi:hypothetical protein
VESLSGLQGIVGWPVRVAPSGLGEPWSSHITMPSQNVGCSWKLSVPPLPFCLGRVGGSTGNRIRYVTLLPEPGW